MIYKVSYTISSEDYHRCFFKDKENAKQEFLKRCHNLCVDKDTWEVSKLRYSLEYWKTSELQVGNERFWLCVGIKVEKLNTRD